MLRRVLAYSVAAWRTSLDASTCRAVRRRFIFLCFIGTGRSRYSRRCIAWSRLASSVGARWERRSARTMDTVVLPTPPFPMTSVTRGLSVGGRVMSCRSCCAGFNLTIHHRAC